MDITYSTLYEQEGFHPLPTNTDDEFVNQLNAEANKIMAERFKSSSQHASEELIERGYQPLPTNTNDELVNQLNAESNDVLLKSLKSPALRQLESIVERGHGFDFYRDGMDHFMAFEYGHSKYDEGETNILTTEEAIHNREEKQKSLISVVSVAILVCVVVVLFIYARRK